MNNNTEIVDEMTNEPEQPIRCPFSKKRSNFECTKHIEVKKEDIKTIPYKGGASKWNLLKYYKKGYIFLEELQKKFGSKIFSVKINGKCVVIQDFKGIEVTYDPTKFDKQNGFGIAYLNWNMVRDNKPSVFSNGYDHEVKKDALLQFDSHCRANLKIDKLVELVQAEFEQIATINNEKEGHYIEESMDNIVGNIITTIYLGEKIESKQLHKWINKLFTFAGVPNFSSSGKEKDITDELFNCFKRTPNIQKIREIVKTELNEELLVIQIVWMIVFNGWGAVSSFFATELCCFLRLPKDQKELIRKEADEFLGSEEKSFEKLNSLHYINQFFMEAMRLHHPATRNYGVAINDFILETSDGYYQIKRGDYVCGNRFAAHRDENLFENAKAFSLERDLNLYDKYVKAYSGGFNEESAPSNHKCTSQLTSMYILKMLLIFLTKCDIETSRPLTYTGRDMTRLRASDKPIKVKRFTYQD